MATKIIDYYLTINSPWSYMGAGRLASLAKQHECHVNVYPTNPGDVFSQTGGLPLGQRSAQRQAYRLVELDRWTKFHGLPIVREPKFFPAVDTHAVRAITSAQENGLDALALSQELGRAQWEREENYADIEVVKSACERAGIDFEALGDLSDYAELYDQNTRNAVERGVFGYPAYLYEDELFWGQDRLDFLERALAEH